jgi:hypothetical protein
VLYYAKKYNKGSWAYFIGNVFLTPLITGSYLFFSIRSAKKKNTMIKNSLAKKQVLGLMFVSILQIITVFILSITLEVINR